MSTFTENHKQALTVACPMCNAEKGKNCNDRRTGKAYPDKVYHSDRLRIATKS